MEGIVGAGGVSTDNDALTQLVEEYRLGNLVESDSSDSNSDISTFLRVKVLRKTMIERQWTLTASSKYADSLTATSLRMLIKNLTMFEDSHAAADLSMVGLAVVNSQIRK